MKKVYLVFLAVVFGLFVLQQCKHDPLEKAPVAKPDTTNQNPPPTNYTDTVCFQTQILPLIVSGCAISGCHDTITHQSNLVLTNYNAIMSRVTAGDTTSTLYYYITREDSMGVMPKYPYPKLDTASINKIKQWIVQGAMNTTCANAPCNDTTNVTYNSQIRLIFKSSCVPCHNSKNLSQSGFKFDNYTDAKAGAGYPKFICDISWGAGCFWMPIKAVKLTDCEIKKIKIWIANGYPQ